MPKLASPGAKSRSFAPRGRLPLVLDTGKDTKKAKKITFNGQVYTVPADALNNSKTVLFDISTNSIFNPEALFDLVNTSCSTERGAVFKGVVSWMGKWLEDAPSSKQLMDMTTAIDECNKCSMDSSGDTQVGDMIANVFAEEEYASPGWVLKVLSRLVHISPMEPENFAMVASYDNIIAKIKHFTAAIKLMAPRDQENVGAFTNRSQLFRQEGTPEHMGDFASLVDNVSRATSVKAAAVLATDLTEEGFPKNVDNYDVWASQTKFMQKVDGGGMDIIAHVQVVAHESLNKLLPASAALTIADVRALLAGSPSSATLNKLMGTSGTETGKSDAHMENINMMALRLQTVYTISHLPCLKGIGDLPGYILSKTTKLFKFGADADYGFIIENVVEPHVNGLFREFRRRMAIGGHNTDVYSFDEEAADSLALGITAWSIAERANKRTAEGTFKSPGKDKGPRTGAEARTPVKTTRKEEELLCLKFLETGSCSDKDDGKCKRRHEPRSKEPCKSFASKGRCFFGKACKFAHIEKTK